MRSQKLKEMMDGSNHKSVSSSASTTHLIKTSSTSKSAASDENNQCYHQKTVTKHFMSPTMSTASKAIAPRKKALAERNEISDTLLQRTPNLDLKGTFDISDESLSLNSESSLKSYDLPRSKFRRYKPHRCRDIILRHENEVNGKTERLSGEEIDKESACKEGSVKEESKEEEDEDEEMEEREGFCRRALKLLIVLIVLMVSTLYISSANSPATLQAMEGIKEGYVKIHERLVSRINFKEIVKFLESGNEYFDGSDVGLMKINKTVVYKGIGEVDEVIDDIYLEKVEDISDDLIEFDVQDEKGSEIEEVIEDVDLEKMEEISDNLIEIEVEDENGSEQEQEEDRVDDFYAENLSETAKVVETLGVVRGVEVEDEDEKNISDLDENLELELLKNEALTEPIEEFEDELQEGPNEHTETERIVVGFALFFAVMASMVLAFKLMRKSTDKKDDDQSLLIKSPRNEQVVEEKYNSPLKEVSKRQEPYVELLGEFVVGEMSGSSFTRSSRGIKSLKIIESEVSSHCISLEGFRRAMDLSEEASAAAMHSSKSYGYFTPEKKVSKQEGGIDEEDSKKGVTPTPLRRSNRLRSLAAAVQSP